MSAISQHTDLEHLRAALDASCVVGTWMWDHVRRVVTYDEGAALLLTGDPELADCEICGPIALKAIHPEDMTWLMEHMLQAVQVGGLVLSEYRVFKNDGTVRWLLSRGRTYHDAAGQPARSHGILIDITEMRDGGERYILGNPPKSGKTLEHAADLGIALKQSLPVDAPPELHQAANLMLMSLGRAIAQTIKA
ncbi:PAS domain-containing protein [Methylobacterium sp. WL12]|uniref:PAS domain-containing protein n=1 Tax=Methylobacterium sp. WL12 TaxID=2603890 RepID=UPI0011C8CD5A|nr:PAS domain-containing protein [Methylobacterium sp. WL12]TXM64770.1 PAS domain-containing protein [Methylobacterium sp. WL12]TXN13959.1 PAS domain-containing protein [Methylobacterium sp. WL122]